MRIVWQTVRRITNEILGVKGLKAQANYRSRTSLSSPFYDRLPFAFRPTLRVAVCIVELFIGQVTPFIALIQLSFIQ